MSIDDESLVRVVALAAGPSFIDVTGTLTGTVNGSYPPTSTGERGIMAQGDAAPLDIGVPATGDKLAICWSHTPLEIDEALELIATPISFSAGAPSPPVAPPTVAPPPVAPPAPAGV